MMPLTEFEFRKKLMVMYRFMHFLRVHPLYFGCISMLCFVYAISREF